MHYNRWIIATEVATLIMLAKVLFAKSLTLKIGVIDLVIQF